jgi:glutaminyl-tRNA synthetase
MKQATHEPKNEANMTEPHKPSGRDAKGAKEEPGSPEGAASNFIEEILLEDARTGKHGGRVATRFPPEPNGYLHIGHAKAITISFGLAQRHGGLCNLRFDDTNPTREDVEYVESIQNDIRWLGYDWGDRLYYASDYFEKLYGYAVHLVKEGKAYVDSLDEKAISEHRGSFYKPGKNSPYRDRAVPENLDLFSRMRAGEFPEGVHVLRAKIDMASPNMNMRDPLLYRVKRASHHRTGDAWCIYPMYDFAHPLSDAIEGITHSLCSLEFENHRPLYDWFVENCPVPSRPRQIEFARLHLSYTVMSKRKLLELVKEGVVSGWDDPRMPTLAGMRRRGYTPEAIRAFCERIGVARADSLVDVALLEHAVREDLERRAPRAMAVLRPLRVVVENFPEGEVLELVVPNHPDQPERGTRVVPFSRVLYVERDDFREEAPKKWFRLSPGAEVRLRWACLLRCVGVVHDPKTGEVTELRCTWDPASKGGDSPDGRKVKGTLHWVSAAHAVDGEARLYDRLFTREEPSADEEGGPGFRACLNPASLETVSPCKLEPSLAKIAPGHTVQFERIGYFCADIVEHRPDRPVFNRTEKLRDSWAKIESSMKG